MPMTICRIELLTVVKTRVYSQNVIRCKLNNFSKMLFRNMVTNRNDRQIFQEYKNSLTIQEAVAVMCNTAIGTGMLKLGYVFRCGAMLSCIVNTILGLLSLYGLYIYVEAASFWRQPTFETMWIKAFGYASSIISFIISYVSAVLVMMFYIQFVAQSIQSIINEFWEVNQVVTDNYTIMGIASVLCFIPICFVSSPKTVAKLCYVAIVCIVYLSIHTIYWFVWHVNEYGFDPNGQLAFFRFDDTLANCFSSLSTAYLIAPVAFPGIQHVRNPTPRRLMRVFTLMIATCYILYTVLGLSSYFTFFDENEGGLILDYYPQTWYVTSAKVAITILMILSIPMVLNPSRFVTINMIWPCDHYPKAVWVAVGIVTYFFAVFCAFLDEPWATILSVTCDSFSPLLLFVVPSVLFLKGYKTSRKLHFVGCWFMIAAGIACTAYIFYSYFG